MDTYSRRAIITIDTDEISAAKSLFGPRVAGCHMSRGFIHAAAVSTFSAPALASVRCSFSDERRMAQPLDRSISLTAYFHAYRPPLWTTRRYT